MINKRRYYAPAVGWGIFIFIISTIPGTDIPEIPSWWDLIKIDKLVHMTVYAVLTWLILRGWFKTHKIQNNWQYLLQTAAIVAGCSLYGLFLEWFQEKYCEDRMFEFFDEVANAMGAFGGAVAFTVFKQKR